MNAEHLSDQLAHVTDLTHLVQWIDEARHTIDSLDRGREIDPELDERVRAFKITFPGWEDAHASGLTWLMVHMRELMADMREEDETTA